MPTKARSSRSQLDALRERGLTARALQVRAHADSYDVEKRSIRAVAVTEAPVLVWDWERWDVIHEVLRIDGMELPESGQVPLLDSHARFSVGDCIGSARDWQPATAGGYAASEPAIFFSDDEDGRNAEGKYRDGHLTDFSVGYAVIESVWIGEGESSAVKGKTYQGPCRVATRWRVHELSATPIGADELAKARSKHQPQSNKRENDMKISARMRKLLGACGLPKDATDEQARSFFEAMDDDAREGLLAVAGERSAPAPQSGGQAPSNHGQASSEGDAARAAAEAIENAKTQARAEAMAEAEGIHALAGRLGIPEEFTGELLRSGVSGDVMRRKLQDKAAEMNQPVGGRTEVTADERDKVRAAAGDALAMRSGLRVEKPAPGADEFRGMSLARMAEECLVRAGVSVRSRSATEIAKMALRSSPGAGTSDFPLILANTAGRVLRTAYDAYASTYEAWCRIVDAINFKDMERLQLSEAPDLDLIGEYGEYKQAEFKESREKYRLQKFGKKFMASMEMIVNDDLDAFLRIPKLFGMAAKRKENDVVYAILTGNPVMVDGQALFHAAHNNYVEGTATALSSDALSVARAMFRKQTGLAGSILNLEPKFLIVPASLETQADVLLRSIAVPTDGMSSGVANPWQNKLTPVVEPRLDAASTTAWYLACDTILCDTVEVAFLDGQRAPYIEETDNRDIDGREWKIRHIFNAKAIDHRGLQKQKGAA